MKFGSVCSGIEAASVAWHPFGWRAAWLSEIEPFPSAVLAHHYPDVPNHGDMTQLPEMILNGQIEAPDLFCGGTPCQAFSVAGLRKSLDDARGNLSLVFCEIANAIDHVRSAGGSAPAIVFWENVPGVLSTKDNAFGCFLAGLAGEDDPLEPPGGKWTNAGAVHGPARTVAWRVLDAQYFGVAQRRRRVFVVASARNDFDPASVLLEFDGVRRDTPPSREAGQSPAKCITHGLGVGGECARALTAAPTATGRLDPTEATFVSQPIAFHPTQDPISSTDGTTHGLGCGSSGGQASVAVGVALRGREGGATAELGDEVQNCLRASQGGGDKPHVLTQMAVRRLTPVECEKLQGFPPGYTQIPWRKKPASECPDGPRYKALGNSWAVPVVRWIGSRIQMEIDSGVH